MKKIILALLTVIVIVRQVGILKSLLYTGGAMWAFGVVLIILHIRMLIHLKNARPL